MATATLASAFNVYGNALGASLGSLAARQQQAQQAMQYQAGYVLPVDNFSNMLSYLDSSTTETTPATYPWYTYTNGIGIQPVQQAAEKVVKKVLSFRDELRSEIDRWLEPVAA